MKLINKDLKQRSSKFAPIPSVGMSPIQIVYIGEEIKHRFGSLKKKKDPKRLNDIEIRGLQTPG